MTITHHDEVDPPEALMRLVTPIEPDAVGAERERLQQALGLSAEFDADLNLFAQRIRELTGGKYTGVNKVGLGLRQFFPGMDARLDPSDEAPDPDADPNDGRSMTCEQGFCVYVVTRKKAMVINNVMDYAKFAGNPVIHDLGVQAYIGVPLWLDGVVIGTLWAVDTKVQTWTLEVLEQLKLLAVEVVAFLKERQRQAR